ncbi:hypothetical protein [Metabacillus fastidiosus]|uniref:hypothetical protein n=1 Tax=Metabacillus fastidiosus TaxID=1458 RepID=UPI002E1BF611|nr:hypothetical protein [Metabacillus fastidiosus]
MADQIAALLNIEIQGYYDDFYQFENLVKNKEIPILYAVGYKNLNQKKSVLRNY